MSTDDIDGRFFRVNAVKDNEGVWREYNSNRRILFHQFPEFDPNHGSSGDTLVWDAFLNRLFIQHQDDQYKAMCYRDYMNGKKELHFQQLSFLINHPYFQIVRTVLELKLETCVPMLENVLKTFANVMTSFLGMVVNLDVRPEIFQ